jgi:phage protein D/phage baseplate assembly protein gpV
MSALEVLPRLSVELNGVALDAAAGAALSSVRVLQRLSLPSLCELTFIEPGNGLAAAEQFLPGTSVRISVARETVAEDADALFTGEVTVIHHKYGSANEREVRLRAFDPLHRLRKRQPVRALVELTLGDLARELVRDLGLEVRIEDPGPVWPRLMQWRQSDLELLTEVAARSGLYFTVCGEVLQFLTLEGTGDDLELSVGDTLLEVRFEATTEPACRSVSIRAWNTQTTTNYTAVADSPRVGRSIQLEPAPTDVGASGSRTLVDESAPSDAHASLLAQAELDRRVAGEVTLEAVAAGDVRLQPGRRVQVRGVAPPLEGRYVITSTEHSIDRECGFRSRFETTSPPAVTRARGCVTTMGIVLDVDDPEKLGRIRVSLPNYCAVETDWLEVLSPGGGSGKGLVTLPDAGDRVLLLLPREDPAQAVVLGGLYATDGPPDAGVRDRRVLRYTFVTRGGQRLYLEEEDKIARLENGTGSFVEIAPGRTQISNGDGSYVELTRERVRVHANADIEIEAPGRSLTFRGAKVDFQTG